MTFPRSLGRIAYRKCVYFGERGSHGGGAPRASSPAVFGGKLGKSFVHRPLQRSKPSAFVIAAGRINPSTRASAWPAARTSAPARSIRT